LTMAELETVKETIIEVLVHRLHARAAYPPEKR
jgi:membrane-associated HD superfamily phosphohydrolase